MLLFCKILLMFTCLYRMCVCVRLCVSLTIVHLSMCLCVIVCGSRYLKYESFIFQIYSFILVSIIKYLILLAACRLDIQLWTIFVFAFHQFTLSLRVTQQSVFDIHYVKLSYIDLYIFYLLELQIIIVHLTTVNVDDRFYRCY